MKDGLIKIVVEKVLVGAIMGVAGMWGAMVMNDHRADATLLGAINEKRVETLAAAWTASYDMIDELSSVDSLLAPFLEAPGGQPGSDEAIEQANAYLAATVLHLDFPRTFLMARM